MKNILTIAATAALLSAFTGSVYAQTVTFSGSVVSSCTVTTPATGTLAPNAAPSTTLTGSAIATVICNDTSNSLNVAVATSGNTLLNGTATAVLSGGTGALTGATGSSKALTATTLAAGDTATISAAIAAPLNGLLQSGAYTLVVNATITP